MDRGRVGVTNSGRGLDTRLVPTGAPTGGLVCRYGGLNDRPPFTLTMQHLLTEDAARRLGDLIDGIPLGHVDDANYSCPMDDGSSTVYVLSYAGRSDVDVWYTRTGCQTLSNGYVSALLTSRTGDFTAGIAALGG